MFRPHVVGAMIGQRVEVVNNDRTLHNVSLHHPLVRDAGHGPGASVVLPSDRSYFGGRLACDIHPWERAWLHVLPHPLFDVTGPEGTFALPPLPEGEYEIKAWHEVYREQAPRTVRLVVGQDTMLEFAFEKP